MPPKCLTKFYVLLKMKNLEISLKSDKLGPEKLKMTTGICNSFIYKGSIICLLMFVTRVDVFNSKKIKVFSG